jgi:hypothetical protein
MTRGRYRIARKSSPALGGVRGSGRNPGRPTRPQKAKSANHGARQPHHANRTRQARPRAIRRRWVVPCYRRRSRNGRCPLGFALWHLRGSTGRSHSRDHESSRAAFRLRHRTHLRVVCSHSSRGSSRRQTRGSSWGRHGPRRGFPHGRPTRDAEIRLRSLLEWGLHGSPIPAGVLASMADETR